MPLLDFDTLSFDCYGTLIDWETGILQALKPWAEGRPDGEILEAFGRFEAEEEKASPGALYPDILTRVHGRLAQHWSLDSSDRAAADFGASVQHWPAFEDSPAALAVLKRHFRLVILSNIDHASFRASAEKLGVRFDEVHTAQDIGSYKPDPRNFHYLLEHRAEGGRAPETLLHTAQSLCHDHVPAKAVGLTTCWIDRRHDQPGWGATKAPAIQVEPDFRFTSLRAMAEAVEAEAGAR